MKKYMGNKDRVLESIYKEVIEFTDGNFEFFFDAFAGTNNVGKFFKKKGYKIISNDINEVSYILGKVYIENNKPPLFNELFNNNSYFSCKRIKGLMDTSNFIELKNKLIGLNTNIVHPERLDEKYDNAITVLTYLSFIADANDYTNDKNAKFKITEPDFIFRNYCEEGSNSEYVNLVTYRSLISKSNMLLKIINKYQPSKDAEQKITFSYVEEVINSFESFGEKPFDINKFSKGLSLIKELKDIYINVDQIAFNKISEIYESLNKTFQRNNHIGRRMFFSKEHGLRIDLILNIILYWKNNDIITKTEFYYLLCALLESVALFSNTSATYQAFYKKYMPNTLQTFRLVIPEIILSDKEHSVFNDDTFNLIERIYEPSSVLYLDPPYNWRLYDSNYHLLNLIAKYHTIPDLLEYEKGIIGASGEYRLNKGNNYTNYNRRSTFEDLLFKLVNKSTSEYIAISYSDSDSNHNREGIDESLEKIKSFFQQSNLFSEFKTVNLSKIYKFESRKDQKKTPISELLFLAKRKVK